MYLPKVKTKNKNIKYKLKQLELRYSKPDTTTLLEMITSHRIHSQESEF
jgi:hypothetical protein